MLLICQFIIAMNIAHFVLVMHNLFSNIRVYLVINREYRKVYKYVYVCSCARGSIDCCFIQTLFVQTFSF